MNANGAERSPHRNGARPRLVGRLSAVPAESGLVVYSASRRLVFRSAETGAAATIQKILSALDGDHDRADICAEAGVGSRDLDQALDAFDHAGIIEWDRDDAGSDFPLADVRDYVSGSLVRPSGYESSHEIREMLAATAVVLACTPPISAAAGADLLDIGLSSVVSVTTGQDAATVVASTRRTFASGVVVCQEDCDDPALFGNALKKLMPESWPILRYQACAHGVEIGPIFMAGYPCCAECFRSSQAAATSTSRAGPLGSALPQDPNFAAALLVNRLMPLLVGDGSVNSWGRTIWTLTTDATLSSSRCAVVPDVSCAECGWAVGREDVQVAAQGALTGECLAESWRGTGAYQGNRARRRATAHLLADAAAKEPAPRHCGYLPTAVLDRTGRYEQWLAGALLGVVGDVLEQFAALAEKNGSAPQQGGRLIPYLLAPDGLFEIPGSIFIYEHQSRQIVSVNSEGQSLARYSKTVSSCDGEFCRCPHRHTLARCLTMIFVGTGASREWESTVAWRLAHLRTGYAISELTRFARRTGVGLFARAAVGQQALEQMLELWPGREFITAAVEISREAGGHECP